MALGSSGAYLVDTRSTTLEPINDGIFTVTTNAIRLEASGLVGTDVATVQLLVGPDNSDIWVDLFVGGQAVTMDAFNCQRIIVLGGKYRVHYEGESEVVVYSEQDRMELDKNVFYNFQQPVSGVGGSGDGFTLSVEDTESVDLGYVGNTSAGTISADVNISADVGNAVEIRADGLYATAGNFNIPYGGNQTEDFTVASVSTAYTVTTASEGTITVSLPAAVDAANQIYLLLSQNVDGTITVAPDGTDTLNGLGATTTLSDATTMFLYSNGVDGWFTFVGGI